MTSTSPPSETVQGNAKTLRRQDLIDRIATVLPGVESQKVPDGSTVGTSFLDQVVRALNGEPAALKSTYRKIEFSLDRAGEVYDPFHDSSEHLARLGGGTVTNSGYRKLLRGLSGEPQCFILAIADHPVSADYADVPGESYGFDQGVSGRVAFLEAGAGSRVVFYRTSKASESPKQSFIAHAVIESITEFEPGRYRAQLADYEEFGDPVPVEAVEISGWNRQHGIAEIDFATLAALVASGDGGVINDEEVLPPGIGSPIPADVLDENAAARLLARLGAVDAPLSLDGIADQLPETLPSPYGAPSDEIAATLDDDSDDTEGESPRTRVGGKARQALDRWIEHRAVFLAKALMAREGWRLHRDCQKLGVGYDLEFRRGEDRRHVEVKGIQGGRLLFNLTAKEWARVIADPDFVVIAVTGLLSSDSTRVRVVTRDQLAAAERRPLQYRLSVETL